MYGMNSVSPLSSQIQGSHVISANPTAGPRGLFNITSTPLTTVHQIAAASDIMGMPLPSDEPRTKSERSTKVYIGKIPNGLSDYFMEQLFLECGHINSWRRILDSSGKPLNFGFVEFSYVEGMLRCLRLMNNLKIQNSKLICRVDTQTEFFIKEWSDLKRADWERKRWDNIMDKGEAECKTWEDEVVKEDIKVKNSIQNIILNFEQHAGDDSEDREDEKEHTREKEREKRIKSVNRDRDRQFKEREKEWIKREEMKEREREKDKEKIEEKERDRIRMLRRDQEYNSSDDETLKKKFSKKFEKIRAERIKMREKEKEEDALNARKEFETLYPGVATAEERAKQAADIEKRNKEFEEEYQLKDHQDLEVKVNIKKEAIHVQRVLPTFALNKDLEDEDPLFNRKHKPLGLPALFEEVPKESKHQPEIIMTEESFNAKIKHLKSLLDKVPRKRSELYAYAISWNVLAQNRIIEKKLGPFISKLFVEYIGQDDRNLVQLVTRMVVNRDNPEKIQDTVEKFLDVDAEVRAI